MCCFLRIDTRLVPIVGPRGHNCMEIRNRRHIVVLCVTSLFQLQKLL